MESRRAGYRVLLRIVSGFRDTFGTSPATYGYEIFTARRIGVAVNLPPWLRQAWQFLTSKSSSILALTVAALALTGLFVGYVADITAAFAAIGLIGLTALPFLALGVVLISHERKKPVPQRNRYNVISGSALVVLALVAVTPRIWTAGTQRPASAAAPISPAPPSQQPPAPPTASSGTAVPLGKACPEPDPTDPSLPAVDLKVVYWCKGEVFTSDGQLDATQYQIKLRPRIVNNTSEPITIAIEKPSAVRLLVTGKQIDQRWAPPSRTAQAGDRPTLVQCNGRMFWAIPPNVPHDAARAGDSGYYTGFATTWDGTQLGPGQSYFHPLRHDQRGAPIQESDLVFQVPLDNGSATIYGLAVLDPEPGGALLGVAPYEEWGPAVAPATF